jgi:hypothetical protein
VDCFPLAWPPAEANKRIEKTALDMHSGHLQGAAVPIA